MLKSIAAICLTLGLFVIPQSVTATHIAPEVGMELIASNICYDTEKHYEKINKVAKNQGFQAGMDKYWAVMADKDTPCYTGMQIPIILNKMLSTVTLENAKGQCFQSQVWEVVVISTNTSERKAYVNWHIRCFDLKL